MEKKIVRSIELFDIETEELVSEIVLEHVNLDEIRSLYGLTSSNPVYHDYEISPNHAKYYSNKYNIEFDFNKFDYFLSCYTVEIN